MPGGGTMRESAKLIGLGNDRPLISTSWSKCRTVAIGRAVISFSSLPRRRNKSRYNTPRWHASVTYSSQCCAVAPGAAVSGPGPTGNPRPNGLEADVGSETA